MRKKKIFTKRTLAIVLITLIMVTLTFSFLYPLFFMLINAMKSKMDYLTNPFGMPAQWTLENFQSIILDYQIGQNIWNSIFIAGLSTILVVLSAAIAGYAFAKLRFRGKGIAYGIIMIVMFLPSQVTMIPKYVMFAKMGLIDSQWAVILSFWAGGLPSAVLLMRNTFKGISNEIIESAKIDGAGFFTIWSRIAMPMSAAGMSIVVIFQFLSSWNDYLTPLLFVTSQSKQSLMVILAQMVNRYSSVPTRQFAGLFISVIPTVIIYLFLQKYMIKGAASGSIK